MVFWELYTALDWNPNCHAGSLTAKQPPPLIEVLKHLNKKQLCLFSDTFIFELSK